MGLFQIPVLQEGWVSVSNSCFGMSEKANFTGQRFGKKYDPDLKVPPA
jgi:hypothetical protein